MQLSSLPASALRRTLLGVLFVFVLCSYSAAAHALAITYGPLAAPQDPPGGGPPTSVKIIWWTDVATSSNTAYVGTSQTGPWPYSGTDSNNSTRHEVLITGLSGESRYYAYVTSGGASSNVISFRTGTNLLTGGSFETWHGVTGQGWGTQEPDGWHGWEIYPWTPPGSNNPLHISISMDRNTGVPTPPVKDGSHRVGMDEGWRSCYGGIYQEVTGLAPGPYVVSGWVAWLFDGVQAPDAHKVEILAKDGTHVPGAVPSGAAIFSQNGSQSDLAWKYVQGSVNCATGTLTIYANLRSDNWDGASFAHFDGFRLMSDVQPAVRFSNFQISRSISGNSYDITISYDTDIPTTTQIDWGQSVQYGNSTPLDPNLVTHHSVQVTGVAPSTSAYHWRAHATAPGGIDEYSSDQTFDAPQVTFSGISAAVDPMTGTICVITWTTNYPTTDDVVYWKPSGAAEYNQQTEASQEPSTTHSVTLSGLSLDTQYDFHVSSGASDIIAAISSPDGTFRTPAQPGMGSVSIGLVMVGGGIKEGGDDVGPAEEVQRMIEADMPAVNTTGLSAYWWPEVQPNDPGDGPNVYDWSKGDAENAKRIVGKARTCYFDVYGSCPSWLTFDSPRYWQKFEEFVEAMTVHMNQLYGDVDFIFDNEPNIYRGPSGWHWADWYMHCLQHFYVAVHRADARTGKVNRVIAGNLCGHSANGFNDLYARGFKNYSDIIGYHAYPNDLRDGLEVADLATIHSIQVAYGDADKKIFVGEGWGSGRSAGFDRSSPTIDPSPEEVENMWLALVKGWDNVMTPRTNWDPSYLYGMRFFTGNDNWGMMNWRKRAIPQKDGSGNIIGFIVDGYWMTPDIAPAFWNGGMVDFYGNSKDCLIHVFPGNGLALMNPGFEIISSPPNSHLAHFWSTSAVPAPTENYGVDEGIFHGGSRSLKLMRTTAGSTGVSQMTAKRSVIPGVQYKARVWCRTQGSSGLTARFYLRFANIDGSQKSSEFWAGDLSGTNDWRQMEVTAAAPSYASRLEVGCMIVGSGTAWFDDVTITMASQAYMGAIRGYTLDEEQNPIANCIVRTTTGGYQAVSDSKGYYEITNVAAGTYDLVCRKSGYVPHRVKNQTVAPGKITFASFNLGIPKSGLSITQIVCDKPRTTLAEGPVGVVVTVSNAKPYPVKLSDVGVFVERGNQDASKDFVILPSQSNPKTIAASASAQFNFTLRPLPGAEGSKFSVNAYAFGQEDRPNLLQNGNFDFDDNFHHWGFWTAAQTSQYAIDKTVFNSSPNALKWTVSDPSGDKFSWAANYSAYGASAPAAQPHKKYIVGAYHKDSTSGQVDLLLYIEEYYYDGTNWFYNGRRFSAVPHRSTWTNDFMVYETGDPNVTPGLYSTNRLRISVGSWIRTGGSSSTSWWDDVYLKEEGDWLADDRADEGAALVVAKPMSSLSEAFQNPEDTYIQIAGPILTAGSESFLSRLYIEQEDRAAGSLVILGEGSPPPRGTRVAIIGRVGRIDGERALLDSTITPIDVPGVPPPVGIIGRTLLSENLSTQGLLVTIWGSVRHVAPDNSYFTAFDGSPVTDGEGHPGVKTLCTGTVGGITPPAPNTFVRITGISGCEQNGAVPVVRPRGQDDIW